MNPVTPPRWARAFLRWFCNPAWCEDIEGDLTERFYNNASVAGMQRARWIFIKEVLLLFRPGIIRGIKLPNNYFNGAMLTNYLKVSFRIFIREKGYTLTNLLGLTLGLSCALFIFLWVDDELRYNAFLRDGDSVAAIMSNQLISGEIKTYHSSPYNLKKVLEDNYPAVDKVAILSWGSWKAFEKGESLVEKSGIDASPEVFDLFEISFVQGGYSAMIHKPNTIAISSSFADSFFGDRWKTDNVVGEMLSTEQGERYELVGIFNDLPARSTLQFNFVVPYEGYLKANPELTKWGNNASQMYVKIADPVSLADAQSQVKNAIVDHTTVENDPPREIVLQPFRDQYLYGRFENGKRVGGAIDFVKILSGAAILIILLASINFVNLSTARSGRRAKETGVRKVLGAFAHNLRIQYLFESLAYTLVALLISVALVSLFLPQFNVLTGKQVSLAAPSLDFVLYAILFTLSLALLTGLYPAFYLASVKTIATLKGVNQKGKGNAVMRKGLVVAQYVITVMMITAAITIYRQIDYIQSTDIGIDRADLIKTWVHAMDPEKDHERFKRELLKRPGIQSVTFVNQNLFGIGNSTSSVKWRGMPTDVELEFYILSGNPDLLATTGIKLKEGRNFDWQIGTDTANYLINEAAQKLMNLSEPLGEDLDLWGNKGKIIGVISDYNNTPLYAPIEPLIIRYDQAANWMILARTKPGQTTEGIASLSAVYHLFNPKREFKYEFMDDVYNQNYRSGIVVKNLFLYFTVLSIIVSSLGLLALVAYTAEQRTREIGIRKVLGANVVSIFRLLSTEFLALIFISLLISLPVGYLVMNRWLNSFAYKTTLNGWLFAAGGALIVLLSLLIIATQVRKAAITSPVNSLKVD